MTSDGVGPRQRDALVTLLVPIGIIVIGGIVRLIFTAAHSPLEAVGRLVEAVGLLLYFVGCHRMCRELKSVTKNRSFHAWAIWIPVINLVYFLGAIPQEMARAKQLVGAKQATRSVALYFLFPLYALAADLNDIVAARPD